MRQAWSWKKGAFQLPGRPCGGATAGDRDVVVLGGAAIIQQCIRAGLLDELQLHLVHILLGGGTSLFGGWTRPASRSSARG
jgi:dihydrofolate reductase